MKKSSASFFHSFILGVLSYLGIWTLLFILSNNHAIPSPITTLEKMWEIKYLLGLHTLASSLRIVTALLLATIFAVPLGIFLSMFPKFDRLLSPLLYFLYPLPKVAFLPVLMLFWIRKFFQNPITLFYYYFTSNYLSKRWGKPHS